MLSEDKKDCIKRESNPRRVELVTPTGNDPGYHYPINATSERKGVTTL
jgi:hypothetical protein